MIYSRTTPELLKSSGTSLIKEEVEVKEEVKEEAKGPKQPPPVDNSEPEYPPFDSVTPEKEKAAPKDKPKTAPEKSSPPGDETLEIRDLVSKLKVKYPRLPIDTFMGKNINVRPDAIRHVLKSLLKNGDGLRSEEPLVLQTYLQSALNMEIGKFNAAEFDKQQTEIKRPIKGEMEQFGNILNRAMAGAQP